MRFRPWILLASLGLLGMVGLVAGCGGLPENAAAEVNGHVITKDDVANRVQQLGKVYGAMIPTEADGNLFTDFRREVTDQLVREQLERQEAESRGLTVTNEEIQARFQEKADDEFLGDVEAMKKSYVDKGMTEQEMADDIWRTILHEKLLEDLGKDINITEEDARAFYDQNRAQYDQPERRQARQLVTDNEAAAVNAVQRVRAGEDFVTVVGEVSIDPLVQQKRGALGLVTQGQLAPELDQALFAMTIGQLSDPINIGGQWYVLSLENIIAPVNIPYEQVKQDMMILSGNQKFSEKYRAFVQQVYDDADIEFAEEYDPAKKVGTGTIPAV